MRTINILIVDDDAGDRMSLKRALRRAQLDCECTEVASVDDALAACETTSFDCVFVDYSMPGHDGLQAIVLLRDRFPFLPIIMSTGQGDEMVATEAMKRGALDYIPKGQVSPEAAARVVERTIEKANLRRKIAEQQEALENFGRVLVHDLMAPISTIALFADVIGEKVEEGDVDGVAEIGGEMAEAALRMSAFIRTLHAYTQAEGKLETAAVDLRSVVADTVNDLEGLIRKSRAKVTFGALPTVSGSAPLLGQLLQNLVSNGIKYSEADVPTVHVDASQVGGGYWQFSVSDNGIGFPEEESEKVFEPFTRLDTQGDYEGTGLGLATCRKIVERHGGKIWCKSKPGEGTVFYFTLPAAQQLAA